MSCEYGRHWLSSLSPHTLASGRLHRSHNSRSVFKIYFIQSGRYKAHRKGFGLVKSATLPSPKYYPHPGFSWTLLQNENFSIQWLNKFITIRLSYWFKHIFLIYQSKVQHYSLQVHYIYSFFFLFWLNEIPQPGMCLLLFTLYDQYYPVVF